MQIQNKLKALRISAGLSHSEIAEHIGFTGHPEHVIAIEEGRRNIGISTIEKWAKACWSVYTVDFEFVGYRLHDLENINITPAIRDAWMEKVTDIVTNIKNFDPETLEDESFREFPDGSGEVFVKINGEEFSIPVDKSSWTFSANN